MTRTESSELFAGAESIISDPLRFKSKLFIGEDAYKELRVKKNLFEAWDVLGVASTGAAFAQTSAVASTFFAPSGLFAVFGIGAAVTPIGWVVTAAVVSGGAWVGVTRYLKKRSNSQVTVIPNIINTPMDVLALGLFDLMAPLALKIASIDEHIHETEMKCISHYFVNEYGYSEEFITDALLIIESNIQDFKIIEVANNLAEFQKNNPDCNFTEMSREIIVFLKKVMTADGKIDEREELAIEKIQSIFQEADKFDFSKSFGEKKKKGLGVVKSIFGDGIISMIRKRKK